MDKIIFIELISAVPTFDAFLEKSPFITIALSPYTCCNMFNVALGDFFKCWKNIIFVCFSSKAISAFNEREWLVHWQALFRKTLHCGHASSRSRITSNAPLRHSQLIQSTPIWTGGISIVSDLFYSCSILYAMVCFFFKYGIQTVW